MTKGLGPKGIWTKGFIVRRKSIRTSRGVNKEFWGIDRVGIVAQYHLRSHVRPGTKREWYWGPIP